MNASDRRRLDGIIDDTLAKFLADPHSVYGPEAARPMLLFGAARRYARAWETPRACAVAGCTNPSVRRSHTVQRAGPLALIAEDQHVLQPTMRPAGTMEMRRVGLREASVFPGFCVNHEQLFDAFEHTRSLTLPEHVVLQCFRVVCRELVRVRVELEQQRLLKSDYLRRRRDCFAANVAAEIAASHVTNVSIDNDPIEQFWNKEITHRVETKERLERGIYAELADAIRTGVGAPAIVHVEIPDRLPLCLAGLGFIKAIDDKAVAMESPVCLCVLPNDNGSDVILGSDQTGFASLKAYVAQSVTGRLTILSAIESWMVTQIDHWFITPSVWDALPADRRRVILDGIAMDDTTMGGTCPFSIFDAERAKLLAAFEASGEFRRAGEKGRTAVEKERSKLSGLSQVPPPS